MTSAITPIKIRAIPNSVCGWLAPGKPKAKFKAPIIAMNVNIARVATDAPIMTTCIALFNSLFKRIPRLAIVNGSAECRSKKLEYFYEFKFLFSETWSDIRISNWILQIFLKK